MIFTLDDKTFMQHDFEFSIKDVKTLINLYVTILDTKNTSHYIEYDSLKRSALFLLVASWENYIEDTIKLSFESLLKTINSPKEMESTFNSIANSWLDDYKDMRPKPTDLILWTNNQWKKLFMKKLEKDVDALNTPNTSNLSHLFKVYFNKKLDLVFYIKNHSVKNTCKRLDRLINIRGEISHRAKHILDTKELKISLKYVKDSIVLIEQLVAAVENDFVSKYKP